MKKFDGRIAVITGAGTGMGRALAQELTEQGCHVALCDVLLDNLAETRDLAAAKAPAGTRITTHECDVSVEAQVLAFRDEVVRDHATDSINLLFNNAGIGGGGSFLNDSREDWEKTYDVCWGGVYYGSRAFLPLLVASTEGYIVNTSSVNGFWASLGPGTAHTAYSAAKFAVKGFTEALVNDLRLNAPHVKAAVVMPGHIGTSIMVNSARILGHKGPQEMGAKELEAVRVRMARQGMPTEGVSDEQIKAFIEQRVSDFENQAPLTSTAAARIILDGVRGEKWRILVGKDAESLDRMVRESPEDAYEADFALRVFKAFEEARDQR